MIQQAVWGEAAKSLSSLGLFKISVKQDWGHRGLDSNRFHLVNLIAASEVSQITDKGPRLVLDLQVETVS